MSEIKIYDDPEADQKPSDVTVRDTPPPMPMYPPPRAMFNGPVQPTPQSVPRLIYLFKPFAGFVIPLPDGVQPPCWCFRAMARLLLGWKWEGVLVQ